YILHLMVQTVPAMMACWNNPMIVDFVQVQVDYTDLMNQNSYFCHPVCSDTLAVQELAQAVLLCLSSNADLELVPKVDWLLVQGNHLFAHPVCFGTLAQSFPPDCHNWPET